VGNRSTLISVLALALTALLVWFSSALSRLLDEPGPKRPDGESGLGFRAVPRQSLGFKQLPTKRSGAPKGPVVDDCAIFSDDVEVGAEARDSVAWRHKASPTLQLRPVSICILCSPVPSISIPADLISLRCRLQC